MDSIAAHPIRTYKKVMMTLNGVTRSVVVPVPAHAAAQSHKNQSQHNADGSSDDECIITNDDDCVITDVEMYGPASSFESNLRLSPKQSEPVSVDLDVEPVEIVPADDQPLVDMIDLTLTLEKTVASCRISDSAQNNVTTVFATDSVCPVPRGPTCVVIPTTFHSSTSADTVSIAKSVVSVESQPAATAPATIFRNVVPSQIDPVLPLEMPAAPMVIAPQPAADVFPVSVITAPRTMTKEEALATGWFDNEDTASHLQSQNSSTSSQPTEAPYDASVLLGTLPEVSSFSAEPVVRSDFVSSAELVSLEKLDVDVSDNPTNSAKGVNNPLEIVPVLSNDVRPSSTFISSGNPVDQQCKLEIDVAVDGLPRPLAKETKPSHKFENVLDYFDDDDCDYGALMSEEDEPLTAVVEGMVNEHAACGTSNDAEITVEQTPAVKHGRGRPLKSKLPRSDHKTARKGTNMAKRTGGRPFTAAQRHRLNDCEVSLQQLQLPSATVKLRAVWRYLCCRELILPATIACELCRMSAFELEVVRKFRTRSQQCDRALKAWSEFSIDSSLLPEPTTADTNWSKTSSANKSPSEVKPTSHVNCDVSSEGNKKYLLIRTETGTFVVPVDNAVGCIVSEKEIATMLQPKSGLPPSSYTGEFSKDALLAACSQLKPGHSSNASPSDQPSS